MPKMKHQEPLKWPGTKIVFGGIKSEKELGDLSSYVSQFDAHGYTKQK